MLINIGKISKWRKLTRLLHPSIHPSIYPSIHPSVRPSLRPSVRPSVRAFVCSFYRSVRSSVRPSFTSFLRSFVRSFGRSVVRLFVRPFVLSFFCLFVRPSVRLSVCSFVRSFVRLFVRACVRSFVRACVRACVRSFILLFIQTNSDSFRQCIGSYSCSSCRLASASNWLRVCGRQLDLCVVWTGWQLICEHVNRIRLSKENILNTCCLRCVLTRKWHIDFGTFLYNLQKVSSMATLILWDMLITILWDILITTFDWLEIVRISFCRLNEKWERKLRSFIPRSG